MHKQMMAIFIFYFFHLFSRLSPLLVCLLSLYSFHFILVNIFGK